MYDSIAITVFVLTFFFFSLIIEFSTNGNNLNLYSLLTRSLSIIMDHCYNQNSWVSHLHLSYFFSRECEVVQFFSSGILILSFHKATLLFVISRKIFGRPNFFLLYCARESNHWFNWDSKRRTVIYSVRCFLKPAVNVVSPSCIVSI